MFITTEGECDFSLFQQGLEHIYSNVELSHFLTEGCQKTQNWALFLFSITISLSNSEPRKLGIHLSIPSSYINNK